LTIFFDLEEIKFENFNNSENNIIGVKLAKVLLGYPLFVHSFMPMMIANSTTISLVSISSFSYTKNRIV
jgi:hypothetical protein